MMRKISFAVLLLLIPALAWAAPRTADEWYEEGANQYTLGNFDKAIEAFKQGFSLEPDESKKANYLYNIAQAYRQTHDCKNALFFYKRFLALKANDTVKPLPTRTRKAVEDFITEADTCVRQQTQLSERPPVNNVPPDGEAGDRGRSGGDRGRPPGETTRQEPRKEVAAAHKEVEPDSDPEDTGVTQAGTTGQPRLISARLIGGVSKVNAGSISVPIQATFGVIAGYPIPVNPRLTVEAGAAFTFTPTPYTTNGMDHRGSLFGVMANGGVTYEVVPNLGIRGDVGVGALVFAGIDQSPFTDGAPTSGALGMFHVRAAVSADYAVTPNLVLTAMPAAFSYSPAAPGIVGGGSILSYDFMVGIGYRK
jgi:tetratricopeptide repeat protein